MHLSFSFISDHSLSSHKLYFNGVWTHGLPRAEHVTVRHKARTDVTTSMSSRSSKVKGRHGSYRWPWSRSNRESLGSVRLPKSPAPLWHAPSWMIVRSTETAQKRCLYVLSSSSNSSSSSSSSSTLLTASLSKNLCCRCPHYNSFLDWSQRPAVSVTTTVHFEIFASQKNV